MNGIGEIYNPSWSPDGKQIVFSAMKSGVSNLFVYTIADGSVTQLTDDEFADLHPAWSPDGKTIAFASDRFTTSLDDLTFGPVRVALFDVETRIIRPLTGPPTAASKSVRSGRRMGRRSTTSPIRMA